MNNRILQVMVNFLSALAMVFEPKKVRVKRIDDNARAVRQLGYTAYGTGQWENKRPAIKDSWTVTNKEVPLD